MGTVEERSVFRKVYETLNEAQARWFVAREAKLVGYGGVKLMHELTGMSKPTIRKGLRELEQHRHLWKTLVWKTLGSDLYQLLFEIDFPELIRLNARHGATLAH